MTTEMSDKARGEVFESPPPLRFVTVRLSMNSLANHIAAYKSCSLHAVRHKGRLIDLAVNMPAYADISDLGSCCHRSIVSPLVQPVAIKLLGSGDARRLQCFIRRTCLCKWRYNAERTK